MYLGTSNYLKNINNMHLLEIFITIQNYDKYNLKFCFTSVVCNIF